MILSGLHGKLSTEDSQDSTLKATNVTQNKSGDITDQRLRRHDFKCNAVPWTGAWNRKRALMEKLAKSK